MSQTNIQVPIQQRNHDKEVLEKRKILFGDERFKPLGDGKVTNGGPSSLGQDDKLHPVVRHHCNLGANSPEQLALEEPDMLYPEHTTNAPGVTLDMPHIGNFKQHMSGRRYAGEVYNVGRNVGSTHLQMDPEPHMPPHTKEGPVEMGTGILPKDQ
jgi:hypothetical protein